MYFIIGLIGLLIILFFWIDMYRFIRKNANASIQMEEYLRQLTIIAKKYYKRDFAENEPAEKPADESKQKQSEQ